MATEQELKDTLRLFREFVTMNATQWKLGASHHHPMWGRIAETLGDDNTRAMTSEEYQFVYAER